MDKDNSRFYDETVKELEKLKNIFEGDPNNNEEISLSKSKASFFSEVNGEKSGYKETKNEVNRNGKLVAKVTEKVDLINGKGKPKSVSTTEVEIPSKGIHNVILKNNYGLEGLDPPSKKQQDSVSPQTVNKMNSFSAIEYSPLDMAEYIYWTGDEKGVAFTIEEFLEDGLMTRQEAINFLQSIKLNLDFMQHHYQGMEKMNEKFSNKEGLKNRESYFEKPKNGKMQASENPKTDPFGQQEDAKLSYNAGRTEQESEKTLPMVSKTKQDFNNQFKVDSSERNFEELNSKRSRNTIDSNSLKKYFSKLPMNAEDYDDVLERLKVVDFLYKEYSLEEVIYQLAKVMFSQSLTKGSKEAQKALLRFTNFLEKGVKHGEISKKLEEKIWNVLVAALTDTLSEHSEVKEIGKISDFNSYPALIKELLMREMENRSIGNSDSDPKEAMTDKNLREEKSSVNPLKKEN